MKILKSFDTKTDAEELLDAVKKYWEGNVILIKKHWIKLLIPLLLVILSIFVLNLMLYVIYVHLFDEHKFIFWVLALFYVYTTVSWSIYTIYWIMANIIGQIQAKKKYIDTTTMAELKQKVFEKFMKRTFLTFLVHVLVLIFNATVPFIVMESTGVWSISVAVWALVIDFIFLIIVNRVMYKLIEYEMNFGICTSNSFTSYRQKWFFRTDSMSISTSAIKVIQDSKKWLLGAFFQYWDICIFTDGDLNEAWGKNLQLAYVPDPRRLAKRLNAMIENLGTEKRELID